MNTRRDLVRTLIPEVFQSERSAIRHPRIEADRLGDCPPSEALRAVSAHATESVENLTRLTESMGLRTRAAGQIVGVTFSVLRNRLGDPLLDEERSYRGTLLGMRHGIDAMRLLRATAAREPEFEALLPFCDEWLLERGRLAYACADALDWFADHPEIARKPVWVAQLRQATRAFDGIVPDGLRGLVGAGARE